MQNKNWEQVKELLQQVLTLEAAERNDYLKNSAINPEIRAEVESLLGFEEEAEDLMKLSAHSSGKRSAFIKSSANSAMAEWARFIWRNALMENSRKESPSNCSNAR
jgi:hypothetical protein